MRIKYKILWVEDEKSWYDTTKELFSDKLEEMGFELVSTKCINLEEVKNELEANGLKDYDLLLVDFTLRNSETGDKVVSLIRSFKDARILTDIIFYSSSIERVRDSMRELGLEGVYTADRGEIEDKFELVVKTTIKKFQEVNSMRGLIMAETSDLDDLMLKITKKMLSSANRNTLESYLMEQMLTTLNSNLENLNNSTSIFENKITDTRLFTSFHRAKSVNKIYEVTKTTDKPIGIEKFFDSYSKEVIQVRNLFAHVKEDIENGKTVLVGHSDKREVFDEQRCINIRKALTRYRNILEQIDASIE